MKIHSKTVIVFGKRKSPNQVSVKMDKSNGDREIKMMKNVLFMVGEWPPKNERKVLSYKIKTIYFKVTFIERE